MIIPRIRFVNPCTHSRHPSPWLFPFWPATNSIGYRLRARKPVYNIWSERVFAAVTNIDFSATVEERTRNFAGRGWVFQEIQAWLANPKAPPLFILTGEPGIGKTALAARLVQFSQGIVPPPPDCTRIGPNFLDFYHFCLARRAETTDPLNFTRLLCSQLTAIDEFALSLLREEAIELSLEINIKENYGTVIGVKIETLIIESPLPTTAFVQTVIEPLKSAFSDGLSRQVVVLVDSLDEAAQVTAGESIVDLLAKAKGLPLQVRFILTTRPDPGILGQFETWEIPYLLLAADERKNREDIRLFVSQQVLDSPALQEQAREARLSSLAFEEHIVEASGGNFLYLTWLLPAIARGERLEYLTSPPKDLYEIYLEYLRTRVIFKDVQGTWRQLYRPLLAALVVAREALSIRQLSAFSALSEQMVQDALFDLSQFLDPVSAERGEHTLYHQSLADFLVSQEEAQEFWIDDSAANERIVTTYLEQYAGNWSGCDEYGLRHLPTHMAAASRSEDLLALLHNYSWLREKLLKIDVNALLRDFDLASFDDSARLVQQAIRQSVHVIHADPKQLAGQLWGRLAHKSSPPIEALLAQIKREETEPWLRPLAQSLPAAGGALVRTLVTRRDWIFDVAVTPDGRHVLYTAGSTVTCVDLESGIEQFILESGAKTITAVAVAQVGRTIVTAADQIIMVWEWGSHNRPLFSLEGHTRDIKDIVVTMDGKRAISGSRDRTVRVWDLDRRKLLFTLEGTVDEVNAVAVTEDGRFAFSVAGSMPFTKDDTVTIWDLDTGRKVQVLRGHDHWIRALAVIPNSPRLVSGSYDHTLKIWDWAQRTEQFTLSGHASSVHAVAVTPDGRHAISGSAYGTLKVWDLMAQVEISTLRAHAAEVSSLAVTPDGRRVISGSRDGTVKMWDITYAIHKGRRFGTEEEAVGQHMDEVTAAVVFPRGQWAITGAQDGRFKIWDLASGKVVKTLSEYPHRGSEEVLKRNIRGTLRRRANLNKLIALTPNGRMAITADLSLEDRSAHELIKAWDLEKGVLLRTLRGHRDQVEAVTITPDGQHAVSASHDPTLKIWHVGYGKSLFTLKRPVDGLYSEVIVTPDGRRIVARLTYALEVWEFKRRKRHHTLYPRTSSLERSQIVALAVTPDGRHAISAGLNARLSVWDLATGQEIYTLKGHKSHATQLATTPDGRCAISAAGTTYGPYSPDNSLKIWDLEQGKERLSFTGHQSNVMALAITPDGQHAISSSWDRTVKMWRLDNGQLVATFTGESEILTCDLSPDGLTIIAGERSGRVHVLRLENVTPGPPIVTAWRRPLSSWYKLIPFWHPGDPMPAFGCPACRTWSEVPLPALGTELPCPHCGEHVRLNAFTLQADWRPVAKAWSR